MQKSASPEIFMIDRFAPYGQVPPAELEAILISHPAIADAAVIP